MKRQIVAIRGPFRQGSQTNVIQAKAEIDRATNPARSGKIDHVTEHLAVAKAPYKFACESEGLNRKTLPD